MYALYCIVLSCLVLSCIVVYCIVLYIYWKHICKDNQLLERGVSIKYQHDISK